MLEQRLSVLFALQNVDSQLQVIQEVKGDLPMSVAELQSKVDTTKNKLDELNALIKHLKVQRDLSDVEMIEVNEKIEKYKGQQLQVKSNKQYDALTKEIETAESAITRSAKEVEDNEGKIQIAKQDIETLTADLQLLSTELEEKQGDLAAVNEEHEVEETRLNQERAILIAQVQKEDLERYERIRKARGGTAVVPVKRSACGGCFKSIPPQKILELRQHLRLYLCEHCGRIIVSDEFAVQAVAAV